MTIVVWVLLAAAGLLALICAFGAAAMRDPLQRLHWIAAPAAVSSALVTVAVFVADRDKDVGLKAAFVTLALATMNGVVAHATARAARVHAHGTWLPVRGEHVPICGEDDEVET